MGKEIVQRKVVEVGEVLKSFKKFGQEKNLIGERELRRLLSEHLQLREIHLNIFIDSLRTQDQS